MNRIKYSNGIAHYIECREGYDRLLDMESFGGKIRDTEDEFKGAEFRDDDTKLMFAYDYKNKFTIRVWGSTFKPALYRELKRLGVKIFDRTEATSLLLSEEDGKRRGAGAVGMNVRTGKNSRVPGKVDDSDHVPSCQSLALQSDLVGLANSVLLRASAAATRWDGEPASSSP